MARATDNNSGKPDSSIRLPQSIRNEEKADKVNALLHEWESKGMPGQLLTRRMARKFLNGRGLSARNWLAQNG
jgi:hypothetical protein